MLAPLRDYLRPRDPTSSPLLATTKEHYFAQLSRTFSTGDPNFEEVRWILLEDANLEHLLDVFTSIDSNSEAVWEACDKFMYQLYWHKPRLVVLGPKIEALPDNHPSKPICLWRLSCLFDSTGNLMERQRLLAHTLTLWREREDDFWIAQTLWALSDTNRHLDLLEEGIQQAKEGSDIFERLGNTAKQAECLTELAWLLSDDGQIDAAEEAALRAIDLLPEEGENLMVCQGHRVLGDISLSKGELGKAVHHLEVALGVASSSKLVTQLFWIHFGLATVFSAEGNFRDAHTHIERAKSHVLNDTYLLARGSLLQAQLWYEQGMWEKARSEALCVLDVFGTLGATNNAQYTRQFLRKLDGNVGSDPVTPEAEVPVS